MAGKNLRYLIRALYSEESESSPDEKGFYTYDITSFVAVRNAISKTASFAIMTINIPIEFYLQLSQLISIGTYPEMIVELYIVDETERGRGESGLTPLGKSLTKRKIFRKNMSITYMKALDDNPDPERRHIHSIMLLSNPVLFFMSRHLTYTKPLTGRAYDALETFEKYIQEVYSDAASKNKIFKFEKIVNENLITPHVHGQILTRGLTGDIQIPSYLISWYKVCQTPSLYIFDDFRFDQVSDNINEDAAEIYGYLINLADLEQFDDDNTDLRDLEDPETGDIASNIRMVDSVPITSPFLKLGRGVTNLNIFDYSMHHIGTVNINESFRTPHLKLDAELDEYFMMPLIEGEEGIKRNILTKVLEDNLMQDPRVQSALSLYTPDTDKLAVERYTLTKELITKYLVALETFMFSDVRFEFFQFGKIYNLSPTSEMDSTASEGEESDKFFHTPGFIMNIFHRASGTESLLMHTAKVQFIKIREGFKIEEKSVNYSITNALDVPAEMITPPKEKPKDEKLSEIDKLFSEAEIKTCNDKMNDPEIKGKTMKALYDGLRRAGFNDEDSKKGAEMLYEAIASTPNPTTTIIMLLKENEPLNPLTKGPISKTGRTRVMGLGQETFYLDSGKIEDTKTGAACNINHYNDIMSPTLDSIRKQACMIKYRFRYTPPIKDDVFPSLASKLSYADKMAIRYGGARTMGGLNSEIIPGFRRARNNPLGRLYLSKDLRPSDPECAKLYDKYKLSYFLEV
ncbi:MAG: hypothetical protein QXD03_02120 [Candidatus Anstonellales archaeon]